MAEDSIAQVELREKGGAPLSDGNLNSPNGHSTQARSFPSSVGSGSKTSPNPADCYWFAQSGDSPSEMKQLLDRDGVDPDGKENFNKDREERVRVLREKQAEERHRKLEDLKSAAMQAQKFREIQEEERRRKIEEIKYKDSERRHLVEERKRQIWEAEKDRRETILRKSQEREARIEAVRNSQRSSIGFAFGSCMPRLLDLETSLMVGRRSTSQTNVTLSPTTPNARSMVNNQVDGEIVKKRTASAFNLDHRNSDSAHRHTIHEAFFTDNSWPSLLANKDDSSQSSQRHQVPNSPSLKPRCRGSTLIDFPWDTDNGEHRATLIPPAPTTADHRLLGVLTGSGVLVGENIMTQSMSALSASIHRGRRKTDLIPTMPPNRESPRTRSPGRAYSMTRLDQLSQPRKQPLEALREETNRPTANMIKTKSMTHLAFRKGNRNARGVDGRSLRASRSADPRMSKSTSHLAVAPLSVANGRPLSARTSPTRPYLTSGSTSPGRSLRGSSPGSEGSAKRMSQSMWYLASPASAPRPTRTSILRRGALTQAQQNGMSRSMMHLVPKQKEDLDRLEGLPPRAPASPSRPQSSMSQLSLSSHTSQSSTVSMRARSAPRRPRPMSVAGTIPDKRLSNEERQSRSSEKRATMPPSGKPPRAKSVGADQINKEMEAVANNKHATPPTPASRRPPSAGVKTPAAKSTPVTSKEKPKIAPKPTMFRQGSKSSPAQSPTSEHPQSPFGKELPSKVTEQSKLIVEPERVLIKEAVSEAPLVTCPSLAQCETSDGVSINEQINVVAPAVEPAEVQSVTPPIVIPAPLVASKNTQPAKEIVEPVATLQPMEEIKEKLQKEITVLSAISTQQEEVTVIESGQTLNKPKITTEEEAKAALAEKRRLAREQAEREAELERQRQEELRRQEEERLRREEEEQRLWEIEQERSRHAEEERLRKAIEEQQQREEEERLRKEEEAKQKIEKEKAERLAKEEQEKIRKETEEKLRKEEEERAERRKRVEAIMSRTRGKGGNNTPPVTTPTKPTELVLPSVEQRVNKTIPTSITDSVEQNGKADGSTIEMMNESQVFDKPDLLGNIANSEMDKVNVTEVNEGKQASLIEQQLATKIETIFKEEHDIESIRTNGFSHHEVVDSQADADLIMDSQSTPEKKASPLLDNLVEFDLLASNLEPTAPPMPTEVTQLIDLSLGTLYSSSSTEITSTARNDVEHITNEDNVNFNIATNGLDSPFVDNYTRHQESTVADFLS